MSPRPSEPVACPWCGYDVSWLPPPPSDMVCPECGGRQSAADFAFAADAERDAWKKTWFLVLLAPGCGLWIGLVIGLIWEAHPALVAAMPLLLWFVALCAAMFEPCWRSRVSVQPVRRRQQWLFALVAGGALVLASGLVLASVYMSMIVATLSTININVTQALLTALISVFGMASGLLWAWPLMRVRRG